MNEHHHKMYNFEVKPPAECWDRIASDLDASDMANTYPSTLRELSVSPPVSAWQNISAAIDGQKKKTFPLPFLKYAAAAAIIGLLAWGATRILNNGQKNNPAEVAVVPVEKNLPANNDLPATERTDTAIETADQESAIAEARNDAALEQSKRTYASIDIPVRSKIRNVSRFFFIPDELPAGNTRGIDFTEPGIESADEDLTGRYIMLMTPDGNIIRMSRKLGDLICCVSGEEQDDDCIEQMKKWREQLASPTHGHAAGSFMDILGLLKSMQNDQL